MIRRFNYTERQRIPHANLRFRWIEPSNQQDVASFEADFDLRLSHPLPNDAEIVVEAYQDSTVMRFHFGTVGAPHPPSDRRMTAFQPGARPLFRVKVVASNDPQRRLLARADSVAPSSPADAKVGSVSILPVEYVDLGDQIWNVDLGDINKPKLQLNRRIDQPEDISILARQGDFLALAYPGVVRQILNAVLVGPESEGVEDDHPWLLFGARLARRRAPNADDFPTNEEQLVAAKLEWINEVLDGFCSYFEATREYVNFRTREENADA